MKHTAALHSSSTVLMGDVVGSRELDGSETQQQLREMVTAINSRFEQSGRLREGTTAEEVEIISPLTITLGDEFQGVVSDLAAAVEILFAFEEYRLQHEVPFSLHFVTYLGQIDTPLNPERAHGMLGSGLTNARAMLTEKSRSRPRFRFGSEDGGRLPYDRSRLLSGDDLPERWLGFQLEQLGGIFGMLERLTESWREKDFALIASMIEFPDDDTHVGELHGKNRSQIWKRRRTLRIDDYHTLKRMALAIATPAAK